MISQIGRSYEREGKQKKAGWSIKKNDGWLVSLHVRLEGLLGLHPCSTGPSD